MTEMRVCTNRGTGFALVATLAATVVLTTTGAYAGCTVTNGGDSFANPVDVGALPATACGNTCDNTATVDADCATGNSGGVANRDEWFTVTIGVNGLNYDFSMCSLAGFDSKLYVFDSLLNLLGCDDDGCGTVAGPSVINCLQLDAGTYYVVVDGFDAPDCGNFQLDITECLPCTNVLPGNATQAELEDCSTGLPTNDGCNAAGETEVASLGVTIGGTATFDGATRDTDWYRFEVNEAGTNSEYTWSVDSEFPALLGLVQTNTPGNPDCADGTGFISPAGFVNQDDNCAPAAVVTQCVPGQFNGGTATYKFFVAPQFVFVTDCTASSRNAYEATLTRATGCTITVVDPDCDPADFAETQNSDPTPIGGNVACVDGQPDGQYSSDNIFARVYTNTNGDVEITCIEAGIETNSGTADQNVTGRVLFSPTVTPALATAVLQDELTVPVPGGYGPARVAFTFGSPINTPNGQNIIAEMFWDATTPGVDPVGALFPGGNPLGQSGPTYILSNGCGIADYADLASIGFPTQAVIVDYYANAASSFCPADITGPAGPGNPDGNVDSLDFLLLIAEWGSPCVPGANMVCDADITGPTPLVPDGNVDSLDFLLLIAQWGSPGNCP